jgi:ABC-type nitrate/sulfonate/bicarbonate transport system substrate-binding protein
MTSPLSRRADGDAPELDTVRLGFIPLVDCATVVMAAELGFDRRYGIRIEPVRQASWSMVRDGLANGSLDASHALYGMVYGTITVRASPSVKAWQSRACGMAGPCRVRCATAPA